MEFSLTVGHKGVVTDITGLCCGKIKLSYYRSGSPSVLEFCVARDATKNVTGFYEGDSVAFSVEGVNMFYGYIFTKSRTKEQIITVKAYDQLRYLKNKDTYIYSGISCSSLVKLIGEDFRLSLGEIEESGYILPDRIESNKTLFDIILTATELTRNATGKEFILYDDFGRLCFKNIENMTLPLLAKEEMAGLINFSMTTTIDNGVYNKVKLFTGREENNCYMAENEGSMAEWGVLQYTEVLTREELLSGVAFQELAENMLKLKNRLNRTVKIKDMGDPTVRGGSRIWLSFEGGEIIAQTVVVEQAVHTFENGIHLMSLSLSL